MSLDQPDVAVPFVDDARATIKSDTHIDLGAPIRSTAEWDEDADIAG